MPKLSRGRLLGRKSGTATVIEDRVRRSSARNAKLAFYIIALIAGLLASTVATDYMHPILAVFLGVFIGIGVGATAWVMITIWPILRAIWWWAAEITAACTALWIWVFLAWNASLAVRLLILAIVCGIPAAVPYLRHRLMAVAWCFISRHRLRVCFAQFIITHRSGSLPFILAARPTLVGEHVWVWLRPGLSIDDLQGRLDKIAVACWADTVTVTPASTSNAALIRVDIKRRQALTGTVISPLMGLFTHRITPQPAIAIQVPTAVNLPDVATPTIPVPAQREATKPARPKTAPMNGMPVVAGPGGDDISDFID